MREKNLSLNQVFNCDETGLNFRLLPEVTLAPSFEKSAAGRKKAKERVTLNVCSNVSGTIKLPLHLIGKAQRPRCFKGLKIDLLPVKYSGQKNAWMNTKLFHSWFHQDFVPTVRERLKSLGEEPNAVLLLDNCSAHPDAKEIVSDDGAIFAEFLPPNVTSVIQPMDQGVLQAIKKRYKKKLLRRMIIEDDLGGSIIAFLKSVNMKVVVDLVAESWDEIDQTTIRKSWRKIIPMTPSSNGAVSMPDLTELFRMASDYEKTPPSLPPFKSGESNGYCFWRGLRVRVHHTDDNGSGGAGEEVSEELGIECFQSMYEELGFDVDTNDIIEWLDSDRNDSGVQTFTDAEICEIVSQSEEVEEVQEDDSEDEEDTVQCPVSNSDAARMFEQCLSWLEHQPEASVYNTSVLRQLHTLAANKRLNSVKQTKLSKYCACA